MTSGMVRVVDNDSELAVTLGHEMGHSILGTGSRPDFESDADYIGLYLAARAGFDITVAPGFWRRWAIREPGQLRMEDYGFYTHPRSAKRALALDQTIREIHAKQVTVVGRPDVTSAERQFQSADPWTANSLHQALGPFFEKRQPVLDGFAVPGS